MFLLVWDVHFQIPSLSLVPLGQSQQKMNKDTTDLTGFRN